MVFNPFVVSSVLILFVPNNAASKTVWNYHKPPNMPRHKLRDFEEYSRSLPSHEELIVHVCPVCQFEVSSSTVLAAELITYIVSLANVPDIVLEGELISHPHKHDELPAGRYYKYRSRFKIARESGTINLGSAASALSPALPPPIIFGDSFASVYLHEPSPNMRLRRPILGL